MFLVFIRHGEGEHGVDVPRSLDIADPKLTETGRRQVISLGHVLGVGTQDLLVVSPTRRTLETATILRGDSRARLIVSPEVGPRMFHVDRGWMPLRCDQLLSEAVLKRDFPDVEFRRTDLWPAGINTMPAASFEPLARELVDWCRAQNASRTLIVAHDGTVHNYRKLLGESELTIEDRLPPAGYVQATV